MADLPDWKGGRTLTRNILIRLSILSYISAAALGCTQGAAQQSNGGSADSGAVFNNGPSAAATPVPLAETRLDGENSRPAIVPYSQDNTANLKSIWAARMGNNIDRSSDAFTLGPGDLLRISVPLIDQLKDETVRVSEDNTIALPLIGTVGVGGMTEDDLRRELSHRIAKYMYHPQVEVFLKHTEHREVSVLGAVKHPGRYMLSSQSDTIMTMISRAGGLQEDAASRITLIPAATPNTNYIESFHDPRQLRHTSFDESANLGQLGSTTDADNDPASSSITALHDGSHATDGLTPSREELNIDVSRPEGDRYLEMPARAGDVIIVPAAGEVTVQGWVDKPGAYHVTPGLTVLGAIAAAGGANFSSSATLLRQNGDGKLRIPLDLSQLKHGQSDDIAVESGDVVIVERSAVGAIPYSMYFIINKIGFYPPLW